jgi:hypothetical protein
MQYFSTKVKYVVSRDIYRVSEIALFHSQSLLKVVSFFFLISFGLNTHLL